jgi:hypothetical protein
MATSTIRPTAMRMKIMVVLSALSLKRIEGKGYTSSYADNIFLMQRNRVCCIMNTWKTAGA